MTHSRALKIDKHFHLVDRAVDELMLTLYGSISIFDYDTDVFKPEGWSKYQVGYIVRYACLGIPYRGEGPEAYSERLLRAIACV